MQPLDRGVAEVVVGIPLFFFFFFFFCHGYVVNDALENWRRTANEDVERGRTFSWLKQAIT